MKKNVFLTVVLALFAWTSMVAGTGTADNPYTCAEAIAIGKTIPVGTHVFGYIVGGRYDNIDLSKTDQTYGISIADDASETNVDNCFQVATTPAQEAIWHPNLVPSALGKLIIVSGSGNGYGGYPCVENDVTVEAYTAPVSGAPVFADVMPVSGSIYMLDEEFKVSATVTTEDAAGLDSVILAYGDDADNLMDTVMMTADADTFSVMMSIGDEGVKYGKIVAYGANGTMNISSAIEVIASKYPLAVLNGDDFQNIVDTVNALSLNTTENYATTAENYYGASSYHDNFDADNYNKEVFTSADAAIAEAVAKYVLPINMTSVVVGDTVKAEYKLYNADTNVGSMLFICTSTSPLTFRLSGNELTSIRNVEAFDFSLSPNPAASSVLLNKAFERVEFVSLSGRTLTTVYNVEAFQAIDVSSFASGVYFVKVSAEGKTAISKLIKR